MEDTLRVNLYVMPKKVLILVLMEDTLRGPQSPNESQSSRVLILVLMEDTLRADNAADFADYLRS